MYRQLHYTCCFIYDIVIYTYNYIIWLYCSYIQVLLGFRVYDLSLSLYIYIYIHIGL